MDKTNRELVRIENIIFDLDGTLVDSLPGIEYAGRCAVDSVCPNRGSFELRPFIGPPIRDIFRRLFPDIEEEELETLVKKFRKAYDNGGWRKTVLFDCVRDVLNRLEHLKIRKYLATSKPQLPTLKILDLLQIRDYFTEVVCPDSAIPFFPSKAATISYLIVKHGLDHEKTLFVGDTNEDKAAAETSGIKFVAACYGYGNFKEGAVFIDFKINNMSELLQFISFNVNEFHNCGEEESKL